MISDPLVDVAIQELPETLAAIRFAFLEQFPMEMPPDDADVLVALCYAYQLITGECASPG